MRLLTGDELGLLKESIPELCRRPPTDSSGHILSTSWQTVTKRPRPSATSIQSIANSNNHVNTAVCRIDVEGEMSRNRGVLSLSTIPSSRKDSFQFAALRMDGTVETWEGRRVNDTGEANVTPARYRKVASTSVGNEPSQVEETHGSSGWYAHRPVQPIGMVSTTSSSKTLLATADSIGNISILDQECKLLSNYSAYDTNSGTVLTTTKGGYENFHILSCIGGNGDLLAVGGRERGVRVLDLETGGEVWKVSFVQYVSMAHTFCFVHLQYITSCVCFMKQ